MFVCRGFVWGFFGVGFLGCFFFCAVGMHIGVFFCFSNNNLACSAVDFITTTVLAPYYLGVGWQHFQRDQLQ